jgi:hypothetical protein
MTNGSRALAIKEGISKLFSVFAEFCVIIIEFICGKSTSKSELLGIIDPILSRIVSRLLLTERRLEKWQK